ncbi:DeoR/GlpR family DNA-binding transcription regulator [Prosthecomicrobium sp. N25]|uniref:DeoR/GlpR family DNA-binding transcription regulator n=1 Tax=Prosthecomicrobium sp. N25 TaxID=3129254 RepID=UPI00307767F4
MHERERSQFILTLLRERAVVTVRDLQALTGASAATVRRDLQALTEAGLVRRVHGGVESVDKITPKALAGSDFEVARRLNAERKRAIAAAAVAMAEDGESIIINAGSTTYAMAEALIGRRLHILTNSFPMAQTLLATTENRIVLPGGEVYRKQGIVISPFDDDAIQHYTASKMFMSCYAIGPMGVIEADPLIARAEAKLLRRADRLIVLADSSKFEARGALAVAPLSRVSTVVTDDGAPKASIAMLRNAGIEVQVVPVKAGAAREHSAA